MNAATIDTNTFTLRNATNPLIAAVVSYDSGTYTATLTPNSPLVRGTTYTATVKGGAAGVKDVAGNALAAEWTSVGHLPLWHSSSVRVVSGVAPQRRQSKQSLTPQRLSWG